MEVLTRDVRPYWQHLLPTSFGSDDKEGRHLVAMDEVELRPMTWF